MLFVLPAAFGATTVDFSGNVTDGGTGSLPAPFSVGDALTGTIQLDDAAAMPGAMFDQSNLQAFDFSVGSVDFPLDNAQPFGFFNGTVSDDGATLSEFNANTAIGSYPNCDSCSLTLNGGADAFSVSVTGLQNFGVAAGTLASSVQAGGGGNGGGNNNVPEPPALAFFALGLMLVGWQWRRRRSE